MLKDKIISKLKYKKKILQPFQLFKFWWNSLIKLDEVFQIIIFLKLYLLFFYLLLFKKFKVKNKMKLKNKTNSFMIY